MTDVDIAWAFLAYGAGLAIGLACGYAFGQARGWVVAWTRGFNAGTAAAERVDELELELPPADR